ncbi:MAG: hypothetical protein IJ011_07130 [Clostridia bacterium]|nr:hypothetical protein [Clostridia bacterium]
MMDGTKCGGFPKSFFDFTLSEMYIIYLFRNDPEVRRLLNYLFELGIDENPPQEELEADE